MNKSPQKVDRPLPDSRGLPRARKVERKKRQKLGALISPNAEGRKTAPSQGGKKVPRLPHEHDESTDSQAAPDVDSARAKVIRQAYEDVKRGLVNTDHGLEGKGIP